MHTAEPAIDAVEVDVVCSTGKNLSPCFCDRDVTQPVLNRVRYPNEWMPSPRQIAHYLIKRRVPHEDLFLQILGQVSRYRISASQLILETEDSNSSLTFER